MGRLSLALPISQYFNSVFAELSDIIDVLVVRDVGLVPQQLDGNFRRAYHTSGLIDKQFAQQMSREFINLLNSYNVSHMSFDFGPSCLDVCFNKDENDIYWPNNSSRILRPEQILSTAADRIAQIRKNFSGTIALENLDYHQGGAYEYVCNPDFIARALDDLDVYLALDIGHLLVSCFNLNIEPLSYASRLPLERVREVHLSHSEGDNDKHDCPTSYEYELFTHILSRSRPDFVVVEYYSDPGRIIEENIKLKEFLDRKD